MYSNLIAIIILLSQSFSSFSESNPPNLSKNYQIANAITLKTHPEILEKIGWEVCDILELPPTKIPRDGLWLTSCGNSRDVQSGDLSTDGSIKIEKDLAWAEALILSCPNPSWVLSADKTFCFRLADPCWWDIDEVSELKLLAAIAYGESHWSNVYEEMAGIASATIRRRDAAGISSVNQLVKKFQNFSYVVYDGNERFKKLICGSQKNFAKAYKAAGNAINYGEDYANGGCFWDGYDLKVSGTQHAKYRQGFRYSHPSHNIFFAPEPPHVLVKGTAGGYYNTTYISTAAQGRTIFWKLDDDFILAEGVKQCS